MDMEVTVNGRKERREIVEVRVTQGLGPDLLIPFLRKDEEAVHLISGEVIIINIGPGYNMGRDAKYSDISFNKPWSRLP